MQRGSIKTHLLLFGLGLALALSVVLFFRLVPNQQGPQPETTRLDAVAQLRNVLKLGVIETRISQIYEFKKENLSFNQIPIPWTDQKSIVAVRGSGQVGYNLKGAEIISDVTARILELRLPKPTILSVDLGFRFLHEKDTFLNRLTPDDRNQILDRLKNEVRKDLLTKELAAQIQKRTAQLATDFANVYGLTIRITEKK